MKIGVFPGKFLPPHRGHLTAILRAHALCDKLYVAVSERLVEDGQLCAAAGLGYISGALRKRWLALELQGLGIEVLLIDESEIPVFPDGWADYAQLIQQAVAQPIDVIFGGEESYREGHQRHFSGIEYRVIDPLRSQWPISGTEIRQSPYQHWDYIVSAARPFFAKKVLITGPESCGKTTLTHKLAKVFCTSWSNELGRQYQIDEVGGHGDLFDLDDFNRIAHLQYEQDRTALQHANKVCFFDTDAVVTAFFSQVFLGRIADRIAPFIDPRNYDLVIMLKPTVPWVADGLRELGDTAVRQQTLEQLVALYQAYGFDTTKFLWVESSDYFERLETCISAVTKLVHGPVIPS